MHLVKKLIFFFLLCPFPSRAFIPASMCWAAGRQGLRRRWAACFRRDVLSAESVGSRPSGATDTFTGRRAGCYTPAPAHCALSLSVRLSVCKSVRLLLFTTCGKRPRPPPPFFFTIYFLTVPPSPPLRIQLFVPAILIDCLFISGPACCLCARR